MNFENDEDVTEAITSGHVIATAKLTRVYLVVINAWLKLEIVLKILCWNKNQSNTQQIKIPN